MGRVFFPEQRLANAIVLQAAKDYRIILYRLQYDSKDMGAINEKKRIENFFHSSWYELLTDVDADYILKGIENKVQRRMTT